MGYEGRSLGDSEAGKMMRSKTAWGWGEGMGGRRQGGGRGKEPDLGERGTLRA